MESRLRSFFGVLNDLIAFGMEKRVSAQGRTKHSIQKLACEPTSKEEGKKRRGEDDEGLTTKSPVSRLRAL